jgi:hypothetical protein
MDFNSLVQNTLSEQAIATKQATLDQLQAALDVIGFEPTIGTAADVINTVISSFRAALSKESDERKKHIINAGISAISLIPFADVLKLLKLRKNKTAVAGARLAKTYGKQTQSTDRFNISESNVAGGAESVFGGGVGSTSTVYSGDTYAPNDSRIPNSIYGGVLARSGMKSKKRKKRRIKKK